MRQDPDRLLFLFQYNQISFLSLYMKIENRNIYSKKMKKSLIYYCTYLLRILQLLQNKKNLLISSIIWWNWCIRHHYLGKSNKLCTYSESYSHHPSILFVLCVCEKYIHRKVSRKHSRLVKISEFLISSLSHFLSFPFFHFPLQIQIIYTQYQYESRGRWTRRKRKSVYFYFLRAENPSKTNQSCESEATLIFSSSSNIRKSKVSKKNSLRYYKQVFLYGNMTE